MLVVVFLVIVFLFKNNGLYSESVLLKYDDKDTNLIYLEIVDNDYECDYFSYCKDGLNFLNLGFLNKSGYRLDGELIKEK